MRYYQKNSYFPLTLTLLTLVLILFMFYAFTYTPKPSSYPITVEESEPVDVDAYRSDLSYFVATFDDDYAKATNDLSRLIAAETAVGHLLGMRVPSEYKDLHLELAIVFNNVQGALRHTDQNIDLVFDRLDQLRQEYPWLAE
jgi:hypothetical protein